MLSSMISLNTNPHKRSYTRFFYKQHFYKQRQAEIGKKQKNIKQHRDN